jgi:hypothetical protein
MRISQAKVILCFVLMGLGNAASAKPVATLPPALAIEAESASYSDIADLVVISPLIIDVTVRKAAKVAPEQAIGVPVSLQRMLIEADAKGKVPKLKKQRWFLFGSPVAGRTGEIRLSRPNALANFSPTNDALVRRITQEAVLRDAPQGIIGVASAFHSPGTVLGEGETQIFLKTEKDQPVSLTVLSRPDQQKQWAVSTAEVIDSSATAPERSTLLWYRLACGLPRSLPTDRIETARDEDATRAQADYKFVIDALGPCGRKR